MGKLHELLAVEADLEGTQKRIVEEAKTTFTKRADHFIAIQKKLEMFEEAQRNQDVEERKEMVTNVHDKLDYVWEHLKRYYDAVYQKERTNQEARADLVVGDRTLASGVPATFLLGMETKLKVLREMYESIPTLAPGISWVEDFGMGRGVYRAEHPDIKFRTAKTFKFQILVPPTDKHPAQVEKWEEQVPVGKYTTTTQCSMWTPAEKSLRIGRIDQLIQACKQARQRANCQEVATREIGNELFNFIHS